MTQATRKRLSPDEERAYRRDGFLVVDQLLSPPSFQALKEHFEHKLELLPDEERPEDMDVPHFTDPKLFDWLLDDDVLDLVESLLGPDIALFSSHFVCKPAGDGKRIPWHQDAFFWRNQIKPASRALTVWLAIDHSTLENGCMEVIPGSHEKRAAHYRELSDEESLFDQELDPDEVDETEAVAVELRPNQASIHTAALVHGSRANTSQARRCGFTMRYISTDVRFNHEEVGGRHQIYLARGVDRAGNVYADPGKPLYVVAEARSENDTFVDEEDTKEAARDIDGLEPGSRDS